MQGRDEYEADYYGGAPFWSEDNQGGMRWDMPWGGTMSPGEMQPGRMPGGVMSPGGMQPGRMPGGVMPPGGMQPGRMPGEPMSPRETCCQSRVNEILEEMERFEAMHSEEIRRIIAEIRKVCGSIDGRGCMAIEGEPDREMMEMLMELVMDRLDQMPDGMESSVGETDVEAVQMGGGWNWRRNLVETLIWQELLRRRMRRRRHGRRDRY